MPENPQPNLKTSIPAPVLTDQGFTAPSEQEILAGVQADLNAAFGGNVNPALTTPQGQIAISQTAILGDFLDAMLEVFNGLDPAFASGRMQDALGRIYFLTRHPATPTIAEAEINFTGDGLPFLPAGTVLATDQTENGNLYETLQDLSFPAGTPQPVKITLSCQTKGAIDCPANSLILYQGNLGISSLANPTAGIPGKEAEGRQDFEARRAASVAGNAMGQNAALLGALLALEGVEDAKVIDNSENEAQTLKGVTLPPHTLYAVLAGGKPEAIGQAFLAKKPPGCATFGQQKITVTDNNPVYGKNPPDYLFHFDYAEPVPVFINVTLANLPSVPANAKELIAQVVLSYFKAPDTRPKLGETLYASDLLCAIREAYGWARILGLTIGIDAAASQSELFFKINQLPVTDSAKLSVMLKK